MRVLVDTSIWIDFFHKKPLLQGEALDSLIKEGRVVTCLPVMAEVLSGQMTAVYRRLVEGSFLSFDFVDLDWNKNETWFELIELSLTAQKIRVPITGVVDRMILLAAKRANAKVWTLDKPMIRLAEVLKVAVWHPQ